MNREKLPNLTMSFQIYYREIEIYYAHSLIIVVIPVSLSVAPPKKTKSATNLLTLVSSVTKTKTSTPEKKSILSVLSPSNNTLSNRSNLVVAKEKKDTPTKEKKDTPKIKKAGSAPLLPGLSKVSTPKKTKTPSKEKEVTTPKKTKTTTSTKKTPSSNKIIILC
jgi:hypothetical protein